jgi:aspartyl-tRNA(Asn)/glutamyl-tRNA(Gln) amidotransferase subunit A
VSGDDLVYQRRSELALRLQRRELSPVELTENVLGRIEQLNPRLNAFITVTADRARAEAREAEREIAAGRYRGPLHGIPYSLKDLYLTQGIRTTGGSRILREYVPAEDSTVALRLRQAGAILLGKNNMHEFAYGTTTINPHYGATRNPWSLDRITAGSSGGSAAAVAAGLGYLSMGSETGFSIRRPAAFCGVVGLKPTYGRVSRHGMLPAAWSLDHAGPLTRSAEDAGFVLNAIAGRDPRDPASSDRPVPDFTADLRRGVDGLRVGLPRHHYAGRVEPAVESAFEGAVATLSSLGAIPVEVRLPRVAYATVTSTIIMSTEVTASHDRWIHEQPEAYGDDTCSRIRLGYCVSGVDYTRSQRLRRWIADEVAAVLRDVDVLASPTTPQVATPIEGGLTALRDQGFEVTDGLYNLLRLYALVGIPAIAIPCGLSPDGLPISLSIAGRAYDEATILRVAHAYEQATDWNARRPPVD